MIIGKDTNLIFRNDSRYKHRVRYEEKAVFRCSSICTIHRNVAM